MKFQFKSKWIMTLVNLATGVIGLVCIAMGALFLIGGNATTAITGIGCGIVLLLFATVERFELIKGIGIEAKTRDLSRKINDAEEILSKIKEITLSYTPSLIRLASNSGRFTGPQPPESVYALMQSSKKLLSSSGLDRDAIRAALNPWIEVTTIDLTRALLQPLLKDGEREEKERRYKLEFVVNPVSSEAKESSSQLMIMLNDVCEWIAKTGELGRATPSRCIEKLRAVSENIPDFIERGIASSFQREVDLWLPEIEYLEEHCDYRNPRMWLQKITSLYEWKA